jgi:FAD/FMN-containing dehydrogenase
MSLSHSLETLLGERGWVTPPYTSPWERDWLNKFGDRPLGVARPASSLEVSQVVSLCREASVPLVPQGGNTGLVGGSVLREPGGVILSMSRMNGIDAPDIVSGTIEVEAGAVLGALHKSLAGTGLMFPMHLGSEGSAQIGGLISTNAGGSHAFRYGMMQDLVLGLEVVLPDGSVWDGMRRVQKDNSGYQLRKLFCGAEGTLGVVTKAVLKLVPEPCQQITALLAVPGMNAACEIANRCRRYAGEFLSALEFFSDFGLSMALEQIPSLNFPFEGRSTFYLLIEAGAGSSQVPLNEIVSGIIEQAMVDGLAEDGTLAASEAQRLNLWRLREEQPEGQRLAGPQLKHDISVPPRRMAEFLIQADDLCAAIAPGVRPNPFGHLGDGNIHYNLSPPDGAGGFGDKAQALALALSELALKLGGSFAAEHGLGPSKLDLAIALQSPVERKLMKSIKEAVDRNGFLSQKSFV